MTVMYPANLPWVATETGAQVAVGQLGLLIVRKVGTSYLVIIWGKALKERSVTLDDGKERAGHAARKWVSDAMKTLYAAEPPLAPVPTQTFARPGGIGKAKAISRS